MAQPMDPGRLPVADWRSTAGAAWQLVRDDGRALVLVVGLYSAAAAAGLAAPWLVGAIVDEVTAGAGPSTIDRYGLAIVGFVAAQMLLTRLARQAGYRFGERAAARLRETFIERAMALPISVVEAAGTGDLMARSSSDVATVGNSWRSAVPEVFIALLQTLFILGAVFVVHPLLGLLGLTGLSLVAWVTHWYLTRARAAYLAEGAATTEVAEALAATVEGAGTVEAFGLQRERVAAGDASVARAAARRIHTLFLRSVFFPVLDIAYALPLVAVLAAGGALYLDGALSLGAVVAATLYILQVRDPLTALLAWVEELQRGSASFARLHGISQVPPSAMATGAVPTDDRLAVNDVWFAYPGHEDVLRGVGLAVAVGERVAIVGPSGAGKSTLGRLLAGIDVPRAGSVTIGGVPVHELEPAELRRRVALVTQDHHVFMGTLRENLALGSPEATDEEIRGALAAVGADWVASLPEGLETELGAGRTALDARQAQQVALARLVLANPRMLILDEATSLMDPTTARDVERSLAAVVAGRTVIAIAHRLQTAHDADRVAVMEDGAVSEVGSHADLVAAEGRYAAMWQSWRGS